MADPSPPSTPPSAQTAQILLHNLFLSGAYHDLVVRSGDRTWKVHRAIICPHSRYFSQACGGGFKEAVEREIVLEGEEPELVGRMLAWFYVREYGDDTRPGKKEDMVTEARMYAVADKYELGELKEEVKKAFAAAVKFWYVFTNEFLVAVEVVYTSTPDTDRGLRDVVQALTWRWKEEIFAEEDVQELLEDMDGFVKGWIRDFCKAASSKVSPASLCSSPASEGPYLSGTVSPDSPE